MKDIPREGDEQRAWRIDDDLARRLRDAAGPGVAATRRSHRSSWDTVDRALQACGLAVETIATDEGTNLVSGPQPPGPGRPDRVRLFCCSRLPAKSTDILKLPQDAHGERLRTVVGNQRLEKVLDAQVTTFEHALSKDLRVEIQEVVWSEPTGTSGRFLVLLLRGGTPEELVQVTGLLGTVTDGRLLLSTLQPEPEGASPVRPGSGPLPAEPSVGELAVAHLRHHWQIALVNEPGSRLGDDPEDVHDMRVALRRVRTTMKVLGPWLPRRLSRFSPGLGWIADRLGDVRDFDVQLQELKYWARELGDNPDHGLDQIRSALERRWHRHRTRLLAALDSRRWQQLVSRFTAELDRPPGRSPARGRLPARLVGPALIEGLHRKVVRLGQQALAGDPSIEKLHLLRRRARRFRYVLESHEVLWGGDARRFRARLIELQDRLGRHQDAAIAIEHLQKLASPSLRLPRSTLLLAGRLLERRFSDMRKLRASLEAPLAQLKGKRWKRFMDAMHCEAERVVSSGTDLRPAARAQARKGGTTP